MPHKRLMAQIRKHVPQVEFTKHELVDKGHVLAIKLDGHMKDLSRPDSNFEMVHIDSAKGACASVDSSDTEHGRETLNRFDTFYGRKPRLVHEGEDTIAHEYWSDKLHPEMAPKWERLITSHGRRIIKKNY